MIKTDIMELYHRHIKQHTNIDFIVINLIIIIPTH